MMEERRLTFAHWFNLILAGAAFAFFVANQFEAFGGERLDLTGTTGRAALTGFLALGILGQLAKIVRGHHTGLEVVTTLFLLVAHIFAEVTIWVRTQIAGVGIPRTLPQYIVGLYWIVGVFDLLALYGPREFALLRTGKTESASIAEQLADTKRQLALALQAQKHAERLAERAEQQASHSANAVQSHYEAQCEYCGKVFSATTERGLANALNGHRRFCQAVKQNGRKTTPVREP